MSIAYQVFGNGPLDLVFVHGWVSNIEVFWEEPSLSRDPDYPLPIAGSTPSKGFPANGACLLSIGTA